MRGAEVLLCVLLAHAKAADNPADVSYPHIATSARADHFIHTFYEPLSNEYRDDSVNVEMIGVWSEVWKARGWDTRVLTMWDAAKHPLYEQVAARLDALAKRGAFEKGIEYEKMCYFRYLAIAVAGGGWMSDYDTIPLNILPGDPMPTEFTSYSRHVPALMVGTADQWTALLLRMVSAAEEFCRKFPGGEVPGAGTKHKSDMIMLLLIHDQDQGKGAHS